MPGPNSFSASNQLKYLNISFENDHHEVLTKNLLSATQSLEKLFIGFDRGNHFHFQPNIIQNLTVLSISAQKSLSEKMVKLIFTNCLKLTEVSLVSCGMSVKALSFVCNNLTSKIKKLCLFLIMFDILEDEHVIAITNLCPGLEELDLGGKGTNFSELALFAIIEKLQNLVKLRLPNSGRNLSEKVLLELGSMPNLKYLQTNHWSRKNPVIKALVKNLSNLKINEGTFEIADPDPDSSNQQLWDIQCKSTNDFYETFE